MKYTIAFSLIFLSCCAKKAENITPCSNSNFEVEKLFDIESSSVYRFQDSGDSHYFVLPQGCVSNYSTKILKSGKTTTVHKRNLSIYTQPNFEEE